MISSARRSFTATTPWMITFADLLALLLTFFVLLFSMSQVRVDAWRSLTDSLNRSILDPTREVAIEPTAERNVARVAVVRASDLDYLAALFEAKLSRDPALARARLTRLPGRLVISLPSDLLFASGSAELGRPGAELAAALGDALRQVGNRVSVAGHSDPAPVPAGGPFGSNWELSLARAEAVARGLKRAGYDAPVAVRGFADSRFYDIAPELDRATRFRLARRVDIVILDETRAPGGQSR